MGVPKEYGEPKGGVRTPKEVWGEMWGEGPQWGLLGGSQWDMGALWGWEEGDGSPKRVWGAKRGCEDPKRGMRRGTPSGGYWGAAKGVKRSYGVGETGGGDAKGGWGSRGCRDSKMDVGRGVGRRDPQWGSWGAANGVQQSFRVRKRGVGTPKRGVGMVGCRETKGSLGTPKRGCRDGAKGVWGGGSKEVGNGDPERGWGERWGVRTP